MKKNSITIALIVLSIALIAVIFSANRPDNTDSTKQKGSSKSIDASPDSVAQFVQPVQIPSKLSFAGESVPINVQDVYERFDRELTRNTYWHSNSIQLFKEASRAFPVIEKILKEEGVPDDFKYLAVAESGLKNVISPAKATGVWQFMKSAGTTYGLEIGKEVDERYNLEKATRAACKYLKTAHKKFGSWTLAAASYNMGEPGLQKALNAQGVNNYYDLHLNSETSKYVFRIMAFKEIFSHPTKYGFHVNDSDLYSPYNYKEVPVDTTIADLAAFSLEQGTNYKTLKILNPWLRRSSLSNRKGKKYVIKIPN